MSKVLLCGVGPLAMDPRASSGPSFRATQFFLPLREDGHEILFFSLGDGRADSRIERPVDGGGSVIEFSPDAMTEGRALWERAARFRADAIVGCGSILPAAAAAWLVDLAPVWADFFGDPIAEMQVKAQVCPEETRDEDLLHVWKLMQVALRRADHFSTVSEAQACALAGILGQIGRLSRWTAGKPLAHSIPCGLLPRLSAPPGRSRFRGLQCPSDAFLVAWSGSYNTWVDEEMLCQGLLRAMERVPRLWFVSTGGGSPGYNEGVYERFKARIQASRFADRVHLFGWIGRDEAEAIHAECDVGLNVDRWCYEGVLGARNRIINFLDTGTPVATTILSEVSRDLLAAGGVIALPLGDPEGMAATLADLAERPARLRATLAKGRAYVRERYTFRRTTGPLLAWARCPERAGDFRPNGGYATPIAEKTDFEAMENELARLRAAAASAPRSLARRALGWLRRKASLRPHKFPQGN